MQRILHILTSPRAEGTPKLVLDWLECIQEPQDVFFLQSTPADLTDNFNRTGKKIYFSPKFSLKSFFKQIGIINRCKTICKLTRPDTVIAWNQGNSAWILLGARLAGCRKLIGHAGCAYEKHPKFWHFHALFSATIVWLIGGKIICASNHIKNSYQTIPFFPNKILYSVHNCFDAQQFIKSNRDINSLNAIYVANLEPVKDHAILINAWKLVYEKNNSLKLLLAGRGSLYHKLQIQIDNLGLKDSVSLLGPQTNIPLLLSECKVFVFPSSNKEGFGTVLLEALAAGLAIVSFAEPAPKEVLCNGEFGMLVYERTPEAFANAILESFSKDILKSQIEKQIKYAQTFTPEKMAFEYLRISNI